MYNIKLVCLFAQVYDLSLSVMLMNNVSYELLGHFWGLGNSIESRNEGGTVRN